MEFETFRNLAYVVAAILFIFGIKGLTHPRTAVRGNMLGASGMLLAAIVTVLGPTGFSTMGWVLIVIGILLGTVGGVLLAVKIQMTAMPELVGAFNGFGGLASFLVGGAALHEYLASGVTPGSVTLPRETIDFFREIGERLPGATTSTVPFMVSIAAAALIGAVTFSGSLIACGKLREIRLLDRLVVPAQKVLNGALALAALILCIWLVAAEGSGWLFWGIVLVSLVLGVFLVTPIGGADMPVVISLLNSYSGLAGAATGFVIHNNVLIIAGSLVGASGLILTRIMCIAMNRSLTNVLFGVMAPAGSGGDADEIYGGKVKATTPDEVAMLFETARRVVVVPGYGMAVAQAQHTVRDLATLLESRGVTVEYGIHPVAGRMPGHMNVLLAEADVPYDQLKEMDDINSGMAQVDIALVIGANDTVNPGARDPGSPIAGMPIIDVDKARTCVVVKRSLSPGFAGIPNPLFAGENTLMMFGDGKKALLELIHALKEAG